MAVDPDEVYVVGETPGTSGLDRCMCSVCGFLFWPGDRVLMIPLDGAPQHVTPIHETCPTN